MGGALVLRFTNNVLTGSDSDADDLWIFEIGPDVEDTTVDVSVDGITWISVGADIDAVGAISTRAVGIVPEPGTWALMIMGFALAGASLRARRGVALV